MVGLSYGLAHHCLKHKTLHEVPQVKTTRLRDIFLLTTLWAALQEARPDPAGGWGLGGGSHLQR